MLMMGWDVSMHRAVLCKCMNWIYWKRFSDDGESSCGCLSFSSLKGFFEIYAIYFLISPSELIKNDLSYLIFTMYRCRRLWKNNI